MHKPEGFALHSAQQVSLVLQEAIASYEKCLELAPRSRNAGQNRLLALNYTFPGEQPFVCKAHEDWGDEVQVFDFSFTAYLTGPASAACLP